MRDGADRDETLERRAIAAHTAYIEALTVYERLFDGTTSCPEVHRDREHACEAAGEWKETCRVAFRNLLDQLGYLPRGLTATLPSEAAASEQHARH